MSDNNENGNGNAFSGECLTPTDASFKHCEVEFNRGIGSPKCIDKPDFFDGCSMGQYQNVVGGADQIVCIRESQRITILKEQSTTVQKKITITSNEDGICIKAAKQITLEAAKQITLKVGKSEIVMDSNGEIKIIGVNITIEAAKNNTIIGKEKVDINPRGTFETKEPAPPTQASTTTEQATTNERPSDFNLGVP
jgi:hypothetical protein